MKNIAVLLLVLITTYLYFCGLNGFLRDFSHNACEMTYMFEYPQFVRISNNADKKYRKYELYAYSEGRLTERARSMHFDGIPVLFIPGNAGSYKQVRSLASIALRKSINSKTNYHFDYFTVNLNDEFSGLNGGVLLDQTLYVRESIRRILSLYKGLKTANPPQSVILFGHSMGGVIARYLAIHQPHDSELFPLVITLASPHTRPPILFDQYMSTFYSDLKKNGSGSSNTLYVSLSGGRDDFLVPPTLTQLDGANSLSVVTTSIPLAWVTADHLCILWCKQVMLALNRALFDSIDPATKEINGDLNYRKFVFYHHLIENSGTKVNLRYRYRDQDEESSLKQLDARGRWIENINRQYSVVLTDGTREQRWYMIKLVDLPKHEMLTIHAINLEVSDWLYACGAYMVNDDNYKSCTDGINLSHLSTIAPSARYKRRDATLNLHRLMKEQGDRVTHVAIRLKATDEPVIIHVDVYSEAERTVEVNESWLVSRMTLIEHTHERSIRYRLRLHGLRHLLQSYYLYIFPVKCKSLHYHSVATLRVPWANEDVHKFFTENDTSPLNVRLYSSRPRGYETKPPELLLTLDPNCEYEVRYRISIPGIFSQFVRHYSALLVSNVLIILLMALRTQIRAMRSGKSCTVFFGLWDYLKPVYCCVLLRSVLLIVLSVYSGKNETKFEEALKLLSLQNVLDYIVIPFVLSMVASGLTLIVAVLVLTSMLTTEPAVKKFMETVAKLPIDALLETVSMFGSVIEKTFSFFLIYVAMKVCGGLALSIGVVYYFFKLNSVTQDYLEKLLWDIIRGLIDVLKKLWFSLLKKPVPVPVPVLALAPFFKNKPKALDNKKLEQIKELEDSSVALDGGAKEEESSTDGKDKEDTSTLTPRHYLSLSERDTETSNSSDEISSSASEKTDSNVANLPSDGSFEMVSDGVGVGVGVGASVTVSRETETLSSLSDDPVSSNEEDEPDVKIYLSFHFILFLIWLSISLISFPAVLTWAHNFSYSSRLHNDPSSLPGVCLSICSLIIWDEKFPKISAKTYKLFDHVILVASFVIMFYYQFDLYGAVVVSTITLNSLVAYHYFNV